MGTDDVKKSKESMFSATLDDDDDDDQRGWVSFVSLRLIAFGED